MKFNIQQFVKGDNRINRKGRPHKEKSLSDILKKHLDEKQDGIAIKQTLAQKLIDLVMTGDLPAIKYIFDRIDGKPTEMIKAELDTTPEVTIVEQYF